MLGNAPSDSEAALYSLYASQIATIVWSYLNDPANSKEQGGNSLRPVIVGLALKRAPSVDGGQSVTDQKRTTFTAIMEMVVELLQKH